LLKTKERRFTNCQPLPRAGFVLANDTAHIPHRHALRAKVIVGDCGGLRHLIPVADVIDRAVCIGALDARANSISL